MTRRSHGRIAKRLATAALIHAVLGGAACNFFRNTDAPTPIDTPGDVFTGTIAPTKSATFTFSVTRAGSVSVTLTSLVPTSIAGVGLGVGTSSTSGTCTVTTSTPNAVPATTPQMSIQADPGSYCVQIADTGSVNTTATFTIRVNHS